MLVQLLTLKDQELLESSDLGVALGCGTNNSSRTFFSVSGGCIKFGGRGGSVGQSHGLTTFPVPPQPEIASTQVSNHSCSSRIRIALPLLIGFGNGRLCGRKILLKLAHCSGVVGRGLQRRRLVLAHGRARRGAGVVVAELVAQRADERYQRQ